MLAEVYLPGLHPKRNTTSVWSGFMFQLKSLCHQESIESSKSDFQTRLDHKWKLSFDFGNSPVPSEWKERITGRLNSIPEVFVQNEFDFGRTDKIKYCINLRDETPFKCRVRSIHPQDTWAVCNHLQQLLDAEVIHESESPFSSPIVVIRKKNGDFRLCRLQETEPPDDKGLLCPRQFGRIFFSAMSSDGFRC